MNTEHKAQDTLAAVCGLYCGACSLYIGSTEEPERLARLAVLFNAPPTELRCLGCRSGRLGIHCRDCEFKACANGKGISFCGECDEYPCAKLAEFQRQRPHRIELWDDLDRIKKAGTEVWIREKEAEYACPKCGTINSAYDLSCRKCGEHPSCAYVAKHQEAVEQHYAEMTKGRE